MKNAIKTDKAPAAIGPYSQGIQASGTTLFVSGQLPLDPATGQFPQGIAAMTKQSLTNVKNIVEAAGMSLDDVVKTVVFMTDLANFQEMNEAYAAFFPGVAPARSTVQVAALPKGSPIEIEAIAIK
jgi:2-iminobutanoate/2-iminopropanoate deaminase